MVRQAGRQDQERRGSQIESSGSRQTAHRIWEKRKDADAASGMTAKKKRCLMLKKAIRQAGRQEGPRNEIRHGRSHRHVGIQTKKIRSMRWSGRIGRG